MPEEHGLRLAGYRPESSVRSQSGDWRSRRKARGMSCIDRRTMCLALGAASLARPAERPKPWQNRPVSEWSKRDIETILNASPWARAVTVHFPLSPGAIGRPCPGPGSSACSSDDLDEHRTITYLIRWDSAKPIREALARGGRRGPIYVPVSPEQAEQFYVISMIILRPDPVSNGNSEVNERLRNRITSLSVLRRARHAELHPSEVGGRRDNVLFQLSFSKADPITPEDSSVKFMTSAAPAPVSLVFPLDEMMFQGELAL